MATVWSALNEYIECEGSGGTLLIGSRAIWCGDHSDLLLSGGSRGGDLVASGQAGRVARDRIRDSLSATLRGVTIDGAFDQDGNAVAGARANVLTLMRTVASFFDDSCTGRGFTLRLTEGSTEYTGTARFEGIGRFEPLNPWTVQTEILLTLTEGRLTVVSP